SLGEKDGVGRPIRNRGGESGITVPVGYEYHPVVHVATYGCPVSVAHTAIRRRGGRAEVRLDDELRAPAELLGNNSLFRVVDRCACDLAGVVIILLFHVGQQIEERPGKRE